MKRKLLLKKLCDAGLTFVEGGNHTRILKDGCFVAVVGRHAEIDDKMVKKIEKQTGVTLL